MLQLFIDTSDNDEPEYQPYTYQPSLLKAIPSSIGQLQSLQHLRLRGCNALTSLPDSLGNLTALTTLQFIGCHSLASLPDSLVQLKALQCLVIDGVNALEKLPDAVGGLSSLKRFFTGYCHKLQRVPPSIGKLGSLTVGWVLKRSSLLLCWLQLSSVSQHMAAAPPGHALVLCYDMSTNATGTYQQSCSTEGIPARCQECRKHTVYCPQLENHQHTCKSSAALLSGVFMPYHHLQCHAGVAPRLSRLS